MMPAAGRLTAALALRLDAYADAPASWGAEHIADMRQAAKLLGSMAAFFDGLAAIGPMNTTTPMSLSTGQPTTVTAELVELLRVHLRQFPASLDPSSDYGRGWIECVASTMNKIAELLGGGAARLTDGRLTSFTWRGDPIANIHEWATARGEQMVRFHASRQMPSIVTGRLETEEYDDEMPASFWDNIRMADGWIYREISRYTP